MNHASRIANSALRWVWRKGFKEPAAIKGWSWTITLWVCILAGFNLIALLVATKQPFATHLAVFLVALWVMRWLSGRKKSPGKPLPYRRKR